MLQIQTVSPASNLLPGAAAEAERAPGDGFESLLAGLMGVALQPAVPPKPSSTAATAALPRLDPDAAATDAAGGDGSNSGGGATARAGADPEGASAPLLRPAVTPLEPGAAPASPATSEAPRGSTPSTALPPDADSAATLPRPTGERPGSAASPEAPRPPAERPAGTASTELPRPLAERPGSAAAPEVLRSSAERPGNAAAPGSPTASAERSAPLTKAEAGKPSAAEVVPSAQRAEARAEAASRPLLEALARRAERAARPVPQGPVAQGPVAQGPIAHGPIAQGPVRQGSVPLGPLPFGPMLAAGGGFAPLTLHAEWQEPLDPDVGRSLTSLPGGTQRLDAIAAEAAAGRTAATPPVQQLAAAIGRAVGGDVQRLTVQLSPEALGSIEIALEVDAERRLAVVIMAERPETVELLRTEARDLQRLLAQQGIDLGDAGLELGLMGGERRERQSSGKEDGAFEAELEAAEVPGPAAPVPGAAPPGYDPVGRPGRLNLSI